MKHLISKSFVVFVSLFAMIAFTAPSSLAQAPTHSETTMEVSLDFRFTRTLRRGMFGNEVRELQDVLAQMPTIYPSGLVSGYFGSFTQTAVRRLQKKNRLPTTGVVDVKTRMILNEILNQQANTETVTQLNPITTTQETISQKLTPSIPSAVIPSLFSPVSPLAVMVSASPTTVLVSPVAPSPATTVLLPITSATTTPTTVVAPSAPFSPITFSNPTSNAPSLSNPTPTQNSSSAAPSSQAPTPPTTTPSTPTSTTVVAPTSTPPAPAPTPSATPTSTVPNPDITPPVISNVSVSSITTNSAVVTWTTNEPTDSLVYFGFTSGAYTMSNHYDAYAPFTLLHTVTLPFLTNGATYHYLIQSSDAARNIARSEDYTFATPPPSSGSQTSSVIIIPAAPTFTITVTDVSKASISWADVSGETSYKVLRRTSGSGGGYTMLALLPANTTAYVDASLSAQLAETSYDYVVQACADDCSTSSIYQTVFLGAPNPPSVLDTIQSTTGTVVLRWSDYSHIETRYTIWRRPIPSTTNSILVTTLAPNASSFTDTGLVSGTAYEYSIEACVDYPVSGKERCHGSMADTSIIY